MIRFLIIFLLVYFVVKFFNKLLFPAAGANKSGAYTNSNHVDHRRDGDIRIEHSEHGINRKNNDDFTDYEEVKD